MIINYQRLHSWFSTWLLTGQYSITQKVNVISLLAPNEILNKSLWYMHWSYENFISLKWLAVNCEVSMHFCISAKWHSLKAISILCLQYSFSTYSKTLKREQRIAKKMKRKSEKNSFALGFFVNFWTKKSPSAGGPNVISRLTFWANWDTPPRPALRPLSNVRCNKGLSYLK